MKKASSRLTVTFLAMSLAAFAADIRNSAAQGVQDETSTETIVGSEIETDEASAASAAKRLVRAIERANVNAEEVRKTFEIEGVEIVFLRDLGEGRTRIDKLLEQNRDSITALQRAIEANAMFYHAVNSRQVLIRDVVALEFDEGNGVTIFVAGRKPGG